MTIIQIPPRPGHKIRSASLQVNEIVTELCEGLKKADQAGIVHRDLKLSNIATNDDGYPKILDFSPPAVPGEERLSRTSYVCVVTETLADIWLLEDFDPDVE